MIRQFGDIEYELPWDGTPLDKNPYLAFDTETELIQGNHHLPRLACLQVTNGRRHVIVHPDQVLDFIEAHADCHWVGWNTSFDWHVIDGHLFSLFNRGGGGDWLDVVQTVRVAWVKALTEGRMRDAMILDFLSRLANPRSNVFAMRNLGQAAAELGMVADKDSDYRLRFGEIINKDWSEVDQGFFDYAIGDVIATHAYYAKLHRKGTWDRCGENVRRHGPLTESLQLRAAVVLDEVTRTGFHLDSAQASCIKDRLKCEIDDLITKLERMAPGVLSRYKRGSKDGKVKAGGLILNASTGVPKLDYSVLRAKLTEVAAELDIDPSLLPRTEKTAQLTTALDPWREVAGEHEFVVTWTTLADTSKLHQFFTQLAGKDTVYPRYNVLVRTGRTSAKGPNIQQMPRDPSIRGLFVPRPGYKLAIVDYSAIELVTLAAVCESRFGESVLGQTLRVGRDPHAYTAALMAGVDYDVFLGWKKGTEAERETFKQKRQAAKAINFGVPGGLGAVKLAAYAKANYGVTLTPEEAKAFRDKLVNDIYPELRKYLNDDACARLALNLGKRKEEVEATYRKLLKKVPWDGFYYMLDKVISGDPRTKANGDLLSLPMRDIVWDGLRELVGDDRVLWEQITNKMGEGYPLWRLLLGDMAVTLTGRVRAGISYTEARNTPFQGLAADGAKVALYNLWLEGHRIVAFIHDEIICEVPEESAEEDLKEIEKIMIDSMSSVLGCDIPVKVEGQVADKWTKG
jgi:DNA polymerase I-like protein with 3'-5' exonuclease and polymerase domains